jgi:hypothetical protein
MIKSPIVAEVGNGDNNQLQIDNTELINHNVNWEVPGTYSAHYFDKKTKKEFNRPIEVTESISNFGFIESRTDVHLNVNPKAIIKEGDKYYLSGSKTSNDPKKTTTIPQEYGLVICTDGKKVLWELLLDDEYSYVSGIQASNGHLYALLTIENYQGSSLKLLEIQNGEIFRELVIANDGITLGNSIMMNDGSLFVHAISNSTAGVLSYIDKSNYIAVVEIRIRDFKIVNSLCYGNVGNNDIIAEDYYEGCFGTVIRISGSSGQFKNIYGGYSGNFIISYSLDLEIIEFRYIDYAAIKNFFMTKLDYVIIVSEVEGNRSLLNIVVMFRGLNYKNVYRWIYPKQNIVFENLELIRSGGGVNFLAINIYDIETKKSFLSGMIEFHNIYNFSKCEYYPLSSKDFQLKTMTNIDNDIYFTSYSGDVYCFYGIRKKQKEEYSKNEITYLKEEVYVNGEFIYMLGAPKEGMFGHYDVPEVLDGILRLICNNRYYSEAKINVVNNHSYDRNLSLDFNGVGYLNDVLIDSGYVVNDPGEYSLVVHGNGEERRVINFKVNDISLKPIIDDGFGFEMGKISLVKADQEQMSLNLVDVTNSGSRTSSIIIIPIIVLSFSIIAFVFPLNKRRAS